MKGFGSRGSNGYIEKATTRHTLLIVDNEKYILSALRRLFHEEGFRVLTAINTEEARKVLEEEMIQVVMADRRMPDMDGLDFLLEVKRRYPGRVLILFTSCPEMQMAMRAVNEVGVFRLITKPWNNQVLIETIHQSFRHYHQIERNRRKASQDLLRSIQSLIETLESRIDYFRGHSQMVSQYAVMAAKMLGMKEEEIEVIKLAGILHDLGLVGIEDKILRKTDKLARREFEIIKNHPRIGAKILVPLSFSPEVSLLVGQHHEHYNGGGYPEGKKGEEIHIGAQILNAAESFDAMTSIRPYRPRPLSNREAVEEMNRCSGSQFDTQVVEAFAEGLYNGVEKAGTLIHLA